MMRPGRPIAETKKTDTLRIHTKSQNSLAEWTTTVSAAESCNPHEMYFLTISRTKSIMRLNEANEVRAAVFSEQRGCGAWNGGL